MAKMRMKLASRGKRFAAALIDMVVPCIVLLVVSVAAFGVFSASAMMPYSYYGHDDLGYAYQYGTSSLVGAGAVFFCIIVGLVYTGVQIYFYTKSQSIGKAILGLKVVSSIDGKPVGIWWMLLREFIVKKACQPVFCLGYIWILIDDRNRGWHDKILDTYVIDVKDTQELNAVV